MVSHTFSRWGRTVPSSGCCRVTWEEDDFEMEVSVALARPTRRLCLRSRAPYSGLG